MDYHELGEPQTIELSYEKYGGWSFLSIGAGPDTWNIDHLQLEHDSQKLVSGTNCPIYSPLATTNSP